MIKWPAFPLALVRRLWWHPQTANPVGNRMQTFYTTKAPPKDANLRLEFLVKEQRKRDGIQSAVVALIVLFILCLILWLIAILPTFKEVPVIISYQGPPKAEEKPVDRPDLAKGMKPKPASSSSSMARVIASSAESPISVPMPDASAEPLPFGIDDDFNAGFGAGDGDGDGGGGSSFFGTPRKGKRVVYLVDFSLSMESDVTGGGTRIDGLKKELIRSVNALDPKMNFNVIYFSHNAWTNQTDGPEFANKGWNGLNQTPMAPWYPASGTMKSNFEKEITAMPPQGNTAWYPPLKMAFAMSPPPDIIYLLSDGEPRDYDTVMDEMEAINPTAIPVDTIAFELPGTPARYMLDISQETGGKFSLVYKGKLVSGTAAERYTTMEWDDKE